ncbi:HAMP domain-containing histidine kinase [bacterium]|nr:HAMP domain-containing histidine kinase [bacterium]
MKKIKENLNVHIEKIDFNGFVESFVNVKPFYPDDYIEETLGRVLKRIIIYTESNRAVLVLNRGGQLSIESEVKRTKKNQITATSLETLRSKAINSLLPLTILYESIRHEKQIHLTFLQTNKQYRQDQYFKINSPASLFCSGVINDGCLQGFLYLESKKECVFDTDENEIMIQMLIDQVSISLESIEQFDQLRQQLREKRHELNIVKRHIKDKNSARIQFLADMNHEIRAPLNTIIGFSQLLMQKGDQFHLPSECKDYIKHIQAEGLTLTEVMDNVLEISRIDSDRYKLKKEGIDIRLLVRGIFHTNRQYADQLGVKLKFQFKEDLVDILYSDRSAVGQLLMILVRNCISRTLVGKSVVIEVGSKGSDINISIRYNGKIIPISNGSDHPVISKENAGSSGCAFKTSTELEIAGRIIERLKAKVERVQLDNYESVINIGFSTNPAEVQMRWNRSVETQSYFASKNRILVYREDGEKDRVLESMLNELGVSPVICNTQEQLHVNLQKLKPHLIIIDLHLPSNSKIWKEIHQRESISSQLKLIPIILITNEKFYVLPQKIAATLNVEILQKPINMTVLVQILKKHLILIPYSQINTDKCETGPNQIDFNGDSMVESAVNDHSAEILEESLIQEFKTLSSTPIFKGGTLINRLKKMKRISEKLFPSYLPVLGKMEIAIFDGNGAQLNRLIKSVLAEKL